MKLPGIYVEIKGDSTQLQADVRQAKQYVTQQAKEISDALNNSLKADQVRTAINKLVADMGTLSRSAHLTGGNFKNLGVDLKDLQRLTGTTAAEFGQLQSRMLQTQAAANQEKALLGIARSAGLTSGEVSKMGKQFGLSAPQIERVKSSLGMVDNGLGATAMKMKTMIATIAVYSLAFTGLAAAMAGVRAIIRNADEYSLIDSKLKNITGSAAEATVVYAGLFDISQKTGTSMIENAQNYTRFATALRDIKIPSSEMLTIFEAVNKSVVVSGATINEATAFMGQFRQGMVSGKFAGDEFKSMMENNAYFGVQLAKALGTDVEGLYKMKTAGQLTTQVLREAFPRMIEQINKDFDGLSKTMARAMVELDNAIADVVHTADKATGATGSVAESISDLATTITQNKEAIAGLFIGLIEGASAAVKGIANVTRSVQGLAIVAASEDKSLWDWIIAGPDDMKKWQSQVTDGSAFLLDRLEQVKSKIREVKGEDKSMLPALFAEKKRIQAEIDAIAAGSSPDDEKRLADALGKSYINANKSPLGKVNLPEKEKNQGRDENAVQNSRLELQKAYQEKELAITKGKLDRLGTMNENAYELGLTSYSDYLEQKHSLSTRSLEAELATRQEELAAAQAAANNISPILDKEGKVKVDQTDKAKVDALKKVQDAEKALIETQNKLTESTLKDAMETASVTRQKLEGYQQIELQYLQMTGQEVAAAKLQAEISAQSVERTALKTEAQQSWNVEAQKALALSIEMDNIEQKRAKLDVLQRSQEAVQALADMTGEHTRSLEAQIKLLDIEIERAELAKKLPEEIQLLRQKRQELVLMIEPLTAFVKGWTDVVNAQKTASQLMYDLAKNTAENMHSAMSDGFFNLMTGKFDSLGDVATSTFEAIKTSFIRMIADMAANSVVEIVFKGSSIGGSTLGQAVSGAANFDWGKLFDGLGGDSGSSADGWSGSSDFDMDYTWGDSGDYTFADGGRLEGGSGKVDDLYMGKVGGRHVRAKGGEYFMPPEQTAKYYDLLEAMRSDSLGFANGGAVGTVSKRATSLGSSSDYIDLFRALALSGNMTNETLAKLTSSMTVFNKTTKGSGEAAESSADAMATATGVTKGLGTAVAGLIGKATAASLGVPGIAMSLVGLAASLSDSATTTEGALATVGKAVAGFLGKAGVAAAAAALGVPGLAVSAAMALANITGLTKAFQNTVVGAFTDTTSDVMASVDNMAEATAAAVAGFESAVGSFGDSASLSESTADSVTSSLGSFSGTLGSFSGTLGEAKSNADSALSSVGAFSASLGSLASEARASVSSINASMAQAAQAAAQAAGYASAAEARADAVQAAAVAGFLGDPDIDSSDRTSPAPRGGLLGQFGWGGDDTGYNDGAFGGTPSDGPGSAGDTGGRGGGDPDGDAGSDPNAAGGVPKRVRARRGRNYGQDDGEISFQLGEGVVSRKGMENLSKINSGELGGANLLPFLSGILLHSRQNAQLLEQILNQGIPVAT